MRTLSLPLIVFFILFHMKFIASKVLLFIFLSALRAQKISGSQKLPVSIFFAVTLFAFEKVRFFPFSKSVVSLRNDSARADQFQKGAEQALKNKFIKPKNFIVPAFQHFVESSSPKSEFCTRLLELPKSRILPSPIG